MNFFKPTESEIKEASSGGMITFKHGQEVEFMIKEVATKPCKAKDPDGNEIDSEMIILGLDVLNTEHKGKTHKLFIRPNSAGSSQWLNILNTFMTTEEIIEAGKNERLSPSTPVGRQIKSVAKVTAKGGKEYVNFYNFSALGGAPDVGGSTPEISADDIPF